MLLNLLVGFKNKIEVEFRKYFPKYIPNAKFYKNIFTGLSGLEIGGPSLAFNKKGFIPIYNYIKELDGCNFSSSTIWEGEIKSGNTYQFENRIGHQYIMDGTDLSIIKDDQYDFVLSSHNLEHIANPIKALLEWKRVIKRNGYLLLILPNKIGTFDIKREYTSLEHLIDDFNNNVTEGDSTHIDEIMKLHDHSRNPSNITVNDFNELISNNYETRCAHHHVFDRKLIEGILNYIELDTISIQYFSSIHIVILAKKSK
jgi:SAM-dependent methyltransferase